MQFQCWSRLLVLIVLLITDFSLAANIALFSTPTSECTVLTTVTTTSISTIPPVVSTSTAVVTATRFNATITVHVSPLSNGATLSSTEYSDLTVGLTIEKRATSAAVLTSSTSHLPNSSSAVTATPTELQIGCLTSTLTTTVSEVIQVPGTLIVTTITSTFLTASTLSITDFLDPATVGSTPTESVTSSTVIVNPQPTPTETSTADTASTRPIDEPSNTSSPIRESTTPALPQNTSPALPQNTPPGIPELTPSNPVQILSSSPGLPQNTSPDIPEPTPSNLVQGSSVSPGLSPNRLPTPQIDPSTTTTASPPGEIRTTNLPSIGPVIIDPSRSAIFMSGVASAITPGQQTTINNIPISFDTSATFVVVDGTRTIGIPPSTPVSQPAPVVIGGTTVGLGHIVTRLNPGEVTTVNGIPISLGASVSEVVVGGTQTIPLLELTQSSSTSMIVVDGTTINVNELGSELAPGEVTVIGTMTITRDTSALIVGTTTMSLAAAPSDMVLGGTTVTAGALPTGFSFISATAGAGLLLPNSQTLMPGAMTTVSGIEISLTPGETPVVVVEGSISITATSTVGSISRTLDNGGTLWIELSTSIFTGDPAQFTGSAVSNTKGSRDMLWISAIIGASFGVACSWI